MSKIVLLFILAMAYSAIRYVGFAPANLEHLPVFVLNKGISMAAAFCFTFAFWQQWRRMRGTVTRVDPATWFRAGIFGVVIHVLLSLAILRPSYFPEFFADDRLSFNGELIFLLGALAAGGIYLLSRNAWTSRQRWWLSIATISLLFGHVLAMGVARGLNLNRSHAYLPPMWLLSLLGITFGAFYLLRSRPDPDAANQPPSVRGT
jgi:hypothetical protein